MKADKLIERLKIFIERHGNLDVAIDENYGEYCPPVDHVGIVMVTDDHFKVEEDDKRGVKKIKIGGCG